MLLARCLGLAAARTALRSDAAPRLRAGGAFVSTQPPVFSRLRKRGARAPRSSGNDDGAVEEVDDDIAYLEDAGDEADAAVPGVQVRDEPWARTVHEALEAALKGPGMEDLKIYSLTTSHDKRVEIRLDKLSNLYGSPSLEDIATVARQVNSAVELELGEEAAGEIEIGVGTPGADRQIQWHELERFSELPFEVRFRARQEDGSLAAEDRVLQIVELKGDAGTAVWRLAEVKANSPGKGRLMNKKMKSLRWTLGADDIESLQLHVQL